MKFKVSMSLDKYEKKPTHKESGKIRFKSVEVNADEMLNLLKQGYAYTAIMKNDWRSGENFECSHTLTFDVDHSNITMDEYISKLEIKPSFAYTSSRNGLKDYGYGYRLVYILSEEICTLKDYYALSKSLARQLGLQFVDERSFCGEQMWFGSVDCQTYISENVLNKECIQVDISLFSEYIEKNSKHISTNNKKDIQTITIHTHHYIMSDPFQRDYENMTFQDLIKKYHTTFINLERTPLEYGDDEPIIYYPLNYYEIRRPWQTINGETLKIKDGERRRFKLFLNGVIRRKIYPQLTFDNLVYNLVYEFEYYYINNGNTITRKDILDIAENVMKCDTERFDKLGKTKHKFFVNPKYCSKHNITPKQVIGQLRNKKQYIGEFYDQSLTDKENIEVMKEYGLDISEKTLKRWRKENDIKKYKKTSK